MVATWVKYGGACQEDQDAPPPRIADLDNLVCDSTSVPEGVTCDEIVQSYVDFLWNYAGDEGRQIILDFLEALDEQKVTITFAGSGGGAGYDSSTNTIYIDSEFAQRYANNSESTEEDKLIRKIDDAAYFGHELFHLVRDSNDMHFWEEGGAHLFQQKLLNNMSSYFIKKGLLTNGASS